MSYLGREELASSYLDYFESYKDKFLDNIKSTYLLNHSNFNDISKDIYENLYELLLVKDVDVQEVQNYIKSNEFNKLFFYEALFTLQADFARNLDNLSSAKLSHASALSFACERLIGAINNTIKTQTNSGASSIKIGSSSGFMIHENFFDAIRKLAQAGEQLEFLNLYNGVPIRTFSKSLRADNDTIIATLELTQILAMKEEGCAYIVNNSYLNNNLKANILWVNTTNMTVALNKFEAQPYMHALKRKYPRVHPDRFTKISLVHQDGRVANGKLFDISQGGMGVVSTEDVGFKSGDILTADIELNSDGNSIFLHLTFRLVVLIVYQNAYRYCLELEPNQKDAAMIEGFAKKREEQTIEELNALIEEYRS